jgi:hypothetical protein
LAVKSCNIETHLVEHGIYTSAIWARCRQSQSRVFVPTLTYTSVNVSRFYKNLAKLQYKLATSVAKIFVNTSILRRCQACQRPLNSFKSQILKFDYTRISGGSRNMHYSLIGYLRFYVPLKNISLIYGDVTIAGEGLQN